MLNFVAKLFWLLDQNKVSPTKDNKILKWDRAFMVKELLVGLEIDFVRMMLEEIHKRVFKSSTTYPFHCLIFQMSRDVRVPI